MKRIFTCFLISVLVLMTSGCKDEDKSSVVDSEYYNVLTCTVLKAIEDTYAQNIAGTTFQPDGLNLEVDAPHGGTINITGNVTDGGNGISRVDLNYAFRDVRWLWSNTGSPMTADVTLNGVIHESGSFRPDDYKNLTATSDNLKVTGTVTSSSGTREADEYGKISLVWNMSKYNGDMFGYTVNN